MTSTFCQRTMFICYTLQYTYIQNFNCYKTNDNQRGVKTRLVQDRLHVLALLIQVDKHL